ncbi:MAG: monovalent cation/H(+) antiporter subunit G [Candidatus Diapherotrites archaeon]|nr:monovalent cation/H(+) antiporter subunit G [Candidatus Diapherotrites archaeon]
MGPLIVYVLIGIGLFFNFLGVVGLFRFPDAYTRLHASTKCTTFGSLFLGLSVLVYYAFFLESSDLLAGAQNIVILVHVVIALGTLLITSATESHAIARAAYRSGLKPVGFDLGGKK